MTRSSSCFHIAHLFLEVFGFCDGALNGPLFGFLVPRRSAHRPGSRRYRFSGSVWGPQRLQCFTRPALWPLRFWYCVVVLITIAAHPHAWLHREFRRPVFRVQWEFQSAFRRCVPRRYRMCIEHSPPPDATLFQLFKLRQFYLLQPHIHLHPQAGL